MKVKILAAGPCFEIIPSGALCDAFVETYLLTFMKGDPGLTPYIGENGNWWVGTEDTGQQAQGEAGKGIVSFTLISTVGKIKTYRLLFTDATYVDIAIGDGADGDKGDKGEKGDKGDTGTGAYQIYIAGGGTLSEEDFNAAITEIPTHIADETIHHSTEDLNAAYESKNSNIQSHISDTTIHHTIDALDLLYADIEHNHNLNDLTEKSYNSLTDKPSLNFEPANANIQSHISDATKHIDNTTEFTGAIDETNDKFTLWDNSLLKWIKFSFTSMKTWLNTLYLKLDQTTPQTIQGLLQNQSTAAMESAPLSAELLSGTGWSSTDWTGDFANGFTHTTGNTTPLTNTLAALNATLYQITWVITNRTAGSVNITFGGVATGAVTASGNIGNRTVSTGTLSIAPTTDFNGTLVISIKRITGTYSPTYAIKDSAGNVMFEIRSSLSSAGNTFLGLGSGGYRTTGSYNTNSGVNGQFALTTGYNNTNSGLNGQRSLTTGSNNTSDGYNSARYIADGATGLTVANNSTYIGAETRAKENNVTNETVIGYLAIGNGSNTVTLGNTSVTDTYLRGRVHTNSSIQIGDDTAVASSANEFAIRGRKGVNGNIGFSVTEMCMPTNVNTWTWVEIVRNEWIIP